METSKIVARRKDGTIVKGTTNDFFPNKSKFHLSTIDGFVEECDIEELKAIFFVKTYGGDESHEYHYSDPVPGGGRKIMVVFADGEQMIGYTQAYSPNRPGFFLTPADLKGNNERVYVVISATAEVKFI
jgi:hypothetical protein